MKKILKPAVLLVVLPAAFLWLAWKLAALPLLQPEVDSPGPLAPDDASPMLPAPDAEPDQSARALRIAQEELLDQRLALARRCVSRGLSVTDREMRRAKLMLVVATGADCTRGCEAERVAEQLNNSYSLEGLRVLLIRTHLDDRMDTPMGVSTVVLPDCDGLVTPHGSDHFLRGPDGELSSAGERHEAALDADEPPPFNPEASIRRRLNLRP